MAAESEIQLGEVEEAAPETELRPDQNRRYAVQAYGEPKGEQLSIFVDLDVMRDMERHAQSDTSVELGGVLLGGQFLDDLGRPFVLISDSLRAEHYEATKGSFKFTHDTWSEITRQRDEFPEELRMVGWYHTHPDWGVFLSGMDTFICDHFFNKPLDVALVIDPCRGDRGFFQWSEDRTNRLPRTAGFFVISSRFRKAELERFVWQLEGKQRMQSTSPYAEHAASAGPYPAPVIHNYFPSGNTQWMLALMVSTLVAQLMLMAYVIWRLNDPGEFNSSETLAANEERITLMVKRLESSLSCNRAHASRAAGSAGLPSWPCPARSHRQRPPPPQPRYQ